MRGTGGRRADAPELVTPRLRLVPIQPADADAFHAYRSDPDVWRYQGWVPGSLEDSVRFVRDQQGVAFGAAGTWFQFAIRLRDGDRMVGDLGMRFPADDDDQAEIGFTIAPSEQRRGYGVEAVRAALDHLLGPAGKHRVFASVDPRNAGSLALLERVGMRREAHFRESLRIRGEWVDDVVFGVLASEWRNR